MRVLIACEFSGIVRDAFIARGHEAVSCDLLPTERPGPHIQDNVLNHLDKGWDMMIAHPPCTYLCRQAWRWYDNEIGMINIRNAAKFFKSLLNSNIEKIAVENPIPHRYAKMVLQDYTQIIQPSWFGHDYSKKTCLWLKNLPKLVPTKKIQITYYTTPNGRRFTKGWYFTPRNGKDRSRTFQGIADAMAEQWGAP